MKFEREQPGLRLHRSLGFWLGLLPAVFLLWVWVDSRSHLSAWERNSGSKRPRSDWVGIANSEIVLRRREYFLQGISYPLPPTGEWGAFDRVALPPSTVPPAPWFTVPRDLKATRDLTVSHSMRVYGMVETRGIAIPLWLLLAIYLVLWIGLLVWWRRRKQRLAGESGGIMK